MTSSYHLEKTTRISSHRRVLTIRYLKDECLWVIIVRLLYVFCIETYWSYVVKMLTRGMNNCKFTAESIIHLLRICLSASSCVNILHHEKHPTPLIYVHTSLIILEASKLLHVQVDTEKKYGRPLPTCSFTKDCYRSGFTSTGPKWNHLCSRNCCWRLDKCCAP